jgi:hypothetical protein
MRKAAANRWRFDRKVVWSPTCLWWVGAIGDDGYAGSPRHRAGDERTPLAVGTRRRTAARRGAATALLR